MMGKGEAWASVGCGTSSSSTGMQHGPREQNNGEKGTSEAEGQKADRATFTEL